MLAIPCFALTLSLFLIISPHNLLAFGIHNSALANSNLNGRFAAILSFHHVQTWAVNKDTNFGLFQSASKNAEATHCSRRDTLVNFSSFFLPLFVVLNSQVRPSHAIPPQKSYSSNARNLDRLSEGNQSGGSSYDNSPSSPRSAKRRAMVGCRFDSSRGKAAALDGLNDLKERDCNVRVMDGDPEFMLRALRDLDCPDCPYGIQGA
mmetsp:Transcript_23642/g.27884  ORF Transcript_23642/g.27884 Transcript_23642/m.27884 type:complete len:206 (-) Transcript_23642:216-833(-)